MNSRNKKRIVILGGGAAGHYLAFKLSQRNDLNAEIILVEKKSCLGGLCASFERHGIYFDFGSHRLHSAVSKKILRDIKHLLGDDLLKRPRNGQIYLFDRFLKFPLKPINLLLKLPFSFIFGIFIDLFKKIIKIKTNKDNNSFSEVLEKGLGKTICNSFYFPYVKKLWGLEPENISPVLAQKRISASNFSKLSKKILSTLPFFKKNSKAEFHYPKQGFGQITNRIREKIESANCLILTNYECKKTVYTEKNIILTVEKNNENQHQIISDKKTSITQEIKADFVFSTIPITDLVSTMESFVPEKIKKAASNLKFRSMLLVYFILQTDQFTHFDAHYFPDDKIIFSRISEPKNYSGKTLPKNLTGICIEIPCTKNDEIWNLNNEEIFNLVLADLEKVKLPIGTEIKDKFIWYINEAYPVYDLKFEQSFDSIDNYYKNLDNFILLGRQGLFTHNNMHHSFEMAYSASKCLKKDLSWDKVLWNSYRNEFEDFVVED